MILSGMVVMPVPTVSGQYTGLSLSNPSKYAASESSGVYNSVGNYFSQNSPYPSYCSNEISLQRYFNPTGNDYFYTTNSNEGDYFVTQHGYSYQGSAAYVYSSPGCGNEPLYRLNNVHEHFYTTDPVERDQFEKNGYSSEGIAGYVFSTQVFGTVPLYRLHNGNHFHFYTTDRTEVANAISSGYTFEEIVAYVYPPPLGLSAQIYGKVSFFCLLNYNNYDTLLTTSISEKDSLLNGGWQFCDNPGGIKGKPIHTSFWGADVYLVQVAGTVPLYRIYDPVNNHHIYTTDLTGANSLVKTNNDKNEGIVAYIYSSQVLGTIPLYHLNTKAGPQTTADGDVASAASSFGGTSDIIGYVYPFQPIGYNPNIQFQRFLQGYLPPDSENDYTLSTTGLDLSYLGDTCFTPIHGEITGFIKDCDLNGPGLNPAGEDVQNAFKGGWLGTSTAAWLIANNPDFESVCVPDHVSKDANGHFHTFCKNSAGPENSWAPLQCLKGRISMLSISQLDGDIGINLWNLTKSDLLNQNNGPQNGLPALVTEVPLYGRDDKQIFYTVSGHNILKDLRGLQLVTICGNWVEDVAALEEGMRSIDKLQLSLGWHELHPIKNITIHGMPFDFQCGSPIPLNDKPSGHYIFPCSVTSVPYDMPINFSCTPQAIGTACLVYQNYTLTTPSNTIDRSFNTLSPTFQLSQLSTVYETCTMPSSSKESCTPTPFYNLPCEQAYTTDNGYYCYPSIPFTELWNATIPFYVEAYAYPGSGMQSFTVTGSSIETLAGVESQGGSVAYDPEGITNSITISNNFGGNGLPNGGGSYAGSQGGSGPPNPSWNNPCPENEPISHSNCHHGQNKA